MMVGVMRTRGIVVVEFRRPYASESTPVNTGS